MGSKSNKENLIWNTQKTVSIQALALVCASRYLYSKIEVCHCRATTVFVHSKSLRLGSKADTIQLAIAV